MAEGAVSLTFHDLSNKNHTKKDLVKKYMEFQADFEKKVKKRKTK